MEILEMPAVEKADETPEWGEAAPLKFEEQALDIEAFELWREASRVDTPADEK